MVEDAVPSLIFGGGFSTESAWVMYVDGGGHHLIVCFRQQNALSWHLFWVSAIGHIQVLLVLKK